MNYMSDLGIEKPRQRKEKVKRLVYSKESKDASVAGKEK